MWYANDTRGALGLVARRGFAGLAVQSRLGSWLFSQWRPVFVGARDPVSATEGKTTSLMNGRKFLELNSAGQLQPVGFPTVIGVIDV